MADGMGGEGGGEVVEDTRGGGGGGARRRGAECRLRNQSVSLVSTTGSVT